jgi:hypothetical protein
LILALVGWLVLSISCERLGHSRRRWGRAAERANENIHFIVLQPGEQEYRKEKCTMCMLPFVSMTFFSLTIGLIFLQTGMTAAAAALVIRDQL